MTTTGGPWARSRLWLTRALIGLLALVSVLGVALWLAAGAAPDWYAPPMNDPALEAMAEATERRVLGELSDAHPSGQDWTLTLTQDEASAWLNVRLPMWAANQGIELPDGLDGWCASFKPGRLSAGVTRRAGDRRWVFTATCTPRDGNLPREPSMTLGLLPLPRWVLDRAARNSVSRADTMPAHLDLGDGRRVRVKQVQVRTGDVVLTLVTEPRRRPSG